MESRPGAREGLDDLSELWLGGKLAPRGDHPESGKRTNCRTPGCQRAGEGADAGNARLWPGSADHLSRYGDMLTNASMKESGKLREFVSPKLCMRPSVNSHR